MSHIEFLGPPGSGKTTIYTALAEEDLIQCPFSESKRCYFFSQRSKRRFHQKGWNVSRFLFRRPTYAKMLVQVGMKATYEPLHLLEMLLGTAGEYESAVTMLSPRTTVVLDEGFLQRALSILFRTEQNSFNLGEYLDVVPLPSILVHVDAPAPICDNRQQNRSKQVLSKPWIETDDKVRVIDQMRGDCSRIISKAEGLGVTIIHVENIGSVEESTNQIKRELRVLLEDGN